MGKANAHLIDEKIFKEVTKNLLIHVNKEIDRK